jgi:hypothetical protein
MIATIAALVGDCYLFKMPFRSRISTAIAGAAVLLASNALSLAGDDIPRPPGSIPVKQSAPRASAPMTTELPPSALGMDTQSRGYEPGDEKPGLKLPDQIQFGNNTLHFDANKKELIPPLGLEPNSQTVINKAPTESPLAPNYLGLRLTTPLR